MDVFNAISRISMAVILFVIEIALGMTGNQPPITQVMDKTSLENINITADLVILAIMITSLLGHVMFRSYLQYKMGNETKELFSNKSVLTMCGIYVTNIVAQPLIGIYFQRPDLLGIVHIPAMALVLPIQILVCHDKAWKFAMDRHPKVKVIISQVKRAFDNILAAEPMEDEESSSQGFSVTNLWPKSNLESLARKLIYVLF